MLYIAACVCVFVCVCFDSDDRAFDETARTTMIRASPAHDVSREFPRVRSSFTLFRPFLASSIIRTTATFIRPKLTTVRTQEQFNPVIEARHPSSEKRTTRISLRSLRIF